MEFMRRGIIVSLALLLANVLQAAPAAVAQNAPANDAQNEPAAVAQEQRANVAQGVPAGVETTQGEPEGRVKGQQVVTGGLRSISLAEALRIAIWTLRIAAILLKRGRRILVRIGQGCCLRLMRLLGLMIILSRLYLLRTGRPMAISIMLRRLCSLMLQGACNCRCLSIARLFIRLWPSPRLCCS